MRFNRLAYQILVVFTVVIIVCLGVSGGFILRISEDIITRKISEGDQHLASRLAQEVEAEIASVKPVVTLLAASQGLRLMQPADVKKEIDQTQKSFPEITNMYVADVEGEQIARTGAGELENVSRAWSFQVAKGGDELISDIYPAPLTSEPMRSITLPIMDDGAVVGVVSADISFRKIMLSVMEIDIGENSSVAVVASNGRVVAHTFMAQLPELDLSEIPAVEAVLVGQKGTMRGYEDELGRLVLGSYSPILELGWGVVIQKPLADIQAEVVQLRTTILLATTGAVLLAVLAGWQMSRQISKPIRQLASASESIARGDLSTPVEVKSSNEIGVLANSFNQMVASLRESRDELEQRVSDLQRVEGELRRYTERLEALRKASLRLTSSLELKSVLDAILEPALELVTGNDAHIFLYDGDRLSFGASRWAGDHQMEPYAEPREDGLSYTVARSGKQIVVSDVNEHPLYKDWQWGGAIVGLPLRSGDQIRGVMNVAFERPHVFADNDLRVLELLADQAAIAIDNARLHMQVQRHADELEQRIVAATEEISRRASELEVLYEGNKEITSTLELNRMLQIIADNAARVVGAEKSLILLIDAEKERLTKVVGHGYSRVQLDGHSYEEFQEGISGWVLREGDPTLSTDIQSDERNWGKALASARRSGDRSVAVAPLIIRDKVIGTLTVVNSWQRAILSSADLNLVTLLAGQAAIAIQNARLYESAQEADRLKSTFLATMSHELRTPLNSIIGFTGIMLQGLPGPLNDEQIKQMSMVRGSARHLLNLISDVLDISKIEAGQLEIVSEAFDMRQTVEKAVQTVAPMAEKKGLTLSAEVSPEVNLVTNDPRRVEQILINLINNAVKFTEKGGVRVECKVSDEQLLTRVLDTGIGIKLEDMDTLFKAFRQIDTGLTRKHEGTGLGLSICKKLVEMLGGYVSVESEWGVGSTFSFTLPMG